MLTRYLHVFIILLCCFYGGNAKATDAEDDVVSISLSTIILFALDNNPDLLIAQERVNQMVDFTKEARADYLPRLEVKVKGGRQYLSPTAGNSNSNFGNTTLQLSQKVFDGHSTTSEVNRRQKVADSAGYSAESQRTLIILDTIKFYLAAYRYQKDTEILERFLEGINTIVSDIGEMYAAGAISKVMNDYAVSRQAAAALEVSRARSSLNDAISNLEFLTGTLPDFIAVSPDELMPEKYDFDLYFERAEQENVAVKINMADLEALKHKLNKEKAAYLPEVDFNVNAKRTYNDGGDVGAANDISATFSMRYEIFDGFLRKHKTSRVGSEIRELKEELKNLSPDERAARIKELREKQGKKATEGSQKKASSKKGKKRKKAKKHKKGKRAKHTKETKKNSPEERKKQRKKRFKKRLENAAPEERINICKEKLLRCSQAKKNDAEEKNKKARPMCEIMKELCSTS